MIHRSKFDQSKRKVRRSKMPRKIQLLAIIFAISISVGYARGPKKMVKGEAASIKEFPHQVSLQKSNGWHFCGGTIIDPELILTAAHCVVDENRNPTNYDIYVVYGVTDKEQRTPENVCLVIRRVHHNYDPADSNKNDIAILKLNRTILFNEFLQPAKLPFTDVPPVGTHVMASGWGATTWDRLTKKGTNYARYLEKLEGTVISQQDCQKTYKAHKRIGPEHLCVLSPNKADTCQGDSGGPVTYNGTVIGITSFGAECGFGWPAVTMRVHYYMPWIATVGWHMVHNMTIPGNSENFVEA